MMGSEELYRCFKDSRLDGHGADWFLMFLYSPLGLILMVTRIFMGFHIFVISCLLPRAFIGRRYIIRFMLMLCGFVVRSDNSPDRSDKFVRGILVSNYRTVFDRVMLDLIHPCVMVNEWSFPPFISWLLGLKTVSNSTKDEFILSTRALCSESTEPLYCRPEGTATSGEFGLLQFSTWPFEVCDKVQPVALRVVRPVPIAITTLHSTAVGDIIWSLFSPYTLYSVRYLPVLSKNEFDNVDHYKEAVRDSISTSLNLRSLMFNKHDKYDLIKRLSNQADNTDNHPSYVYQRQTSNRSEFKLSPELEEMVDNCKSVLPQVPIHVIRSDILKTKDVDMTLSNLLEGNIEYTPEEEPQPTSSTSVRSADPPPQQDRQHASRTLYSAPSFSQKSSLRQLSLAERKQLMYREARLKYIEKHKLKITVEEIERREGLTS